jgi:predicted phosphodiesterase
LLIAVISDVHSNLEALETCLKKIEEIKTDRVVCLGDMVDYCAQPNECIELLRKKSDVILLGNHDEAQFVHELSKTFSENAYISSVYTRGILRDDHLDFFRKIPRDYILENIYFVHSSPYLPDYYKYVLTEEMAINNFNYFEQEICFIGHSHIPKIFEYKFGCVKVVNAENIKKGNKYIINAGSVGQPRDGDYRTCFCTFDTEKFELIYYRLDYDAKKASEKIYKEGLPEYLAERILVGK